jgi:hypothetical protein
VTNPSEATSEMVELTIRIPEQFFTREYLKSDWDAAMAAVENEKKGQLLEGETWSLPEYLIDGWDYDVDRELYGPDGQQVPLW